MGPRRSAVTFLLYLSSCSLAAAQLPANLHRVHDWSTRHVLFSGLTPENVSAAIQSDPRALHSWLDHARHRFEPQTHPQPELDERREPEDSNRSDAHRRHHHRHHMKHSLATDWQMPLSIGVGPRSAPAKFGFNLNAVPDCTNDYAVFPTSNTNTPGSIGPNVNATLIAYNNLYTGPGPSGICPTPGAPALLPSVLFAYNTSTLSTGKADLSPVLSLDGAKIAFIESNDGGGNNYTAFHVLTWKAGEGTALGSPAIPGDCAPGNSCMATLVLSNTRSDSRSEPFIDYALDVAYIGDDGGLLHKITPVFNGTPAEVIGGGWPVTLLPTGGQVQSPVYDSVSGNVFVTANTTTSLFVVNGSSGATRTVSTNALFPSEPIVDSASQTVFVFAVTSGLRLSVLQFNTSGTLLSQVTAGSIGGSANAYTGTFDNNYFSNPSSGSLYFAGSISFIATLYRVGFTGTTMNTAFSGPLALATGTLTSEPTPLTEIFNPSFSTAQDRLFVGIDANCTTLNTDGCIESVDISNGLPPAILSSHSLQTAGSSFSVSGIIVDNVSPLSQASSIYFESFTSSPPESAIKLTQADLQ